MSLIVGWAPLKKYSWRIVLLCEHLRLVHRHTWPSLTVLSCRMFTKPLPHSLHCSWKLCNSLRSLSHATNYCFVEQISKMSTKWILWTTTRASAILIKVKKLLFNELLMLFLTDSGSEKSRPLYSWLRRLSEWRCVTMTTDVTI